MQVIAAQLCYMVARAPLQVWEPTSRLCLLGVDHRKQLPGSLASVAAFQRTEIYEWAMTQGGISDACAKATGFHLCRRALRRLRHQFWDSVCGCRVLQPNHKPEILHVSSARSLFLNHRPLGNVKRCLNGPNS